jgi:hypothetical protein
MEALLTGLSVTKVASTTMAASLNKIRNTRRIRRGKLVNIS